jgi:hypothetical protein
MTDSSDVSCGVLEVTHVGCVLWYDLLVEMLLKMILVFILVSSIKCTRFVIEFGTDKVAYASIEV